MSARNMLFDRSPWVYALWKIRQSKVDETWQNVSYQNRLHRYLVMSCCKHPTCYLLCFISFIFPFLLPLFMKQQCAAFFRKRAAVNRWLSRTGQGGKPGILGAEGRDRLKVKEFNNDMLITTHSARYTGQCGALWRWRTDASKEFSHYEAFDSNKNVSARLQGMPRWKLIWWTSYWAT